MHVMDVGVTEKNIIVHVTMLLQCWRRVHCQSLKSFPVIIEILK